MNSRIFPGVTVLKSTVSRKCIPNVAHLIRASGRHAIMFLGGSASSLQNLHSTLLTLSSLLRWTQRDPVRRSLPRPPLHHPVCPVIHRKVRLLFPPSSFCFLIKTILYIFSNYCRHHCLNLSHAGHTTYCVRLAT